MALRKSVLTTAMILAITSAAPAAFAQSADPVVSSLAASIEASLHALSGTPTDAQIQQAISTALAMSTATLAQKEAALQVVQTAALAAGSTLPAGTAGDVQLAYAAIAGAGGATASGGGANGGAGFGSAGVSLGGGGGGSSYTPS